MVGSALHPSPEGARVAGRRPSAFAIFAWGVLAYLMCVILFGAWVRITGSGAGCGSHWPTCHGQVIPRSPETATVIEFTHRVTSALLGLLAVALVAWSFLARADRPVRIASLVTLAFVVLEALIGAGIVLEELVGSDDSAARATVIAVHLVSTFSLTASTGLVAWSSAGHALPRWRNAPRIRWVLLAALGAVIAVSMTGAITALGDTLFPVRPASTGGLLARIEGDLAPAAHFLVRLRIVHPILAVVVAAGLVALPTYVTGGTRRFQTLLRGVRHAALLQVALGCLNIALGAPGWLQLAHLLAAQGVWLALVFATAEATSPAAARPASS